MATKKKPESIVEFCKEWDGLDHDGKLQLCVSYGVSYETARHWRSDCGIPKEEPRRTMTISMPELLATNPSVCLDFVMFDLETSGFDADWDILLTSCIKPYGQPVKTLRADDYPNWEHEKANDRQMTIDIATELRKHAIVVGHYSKLFDIKFLRAKMFRHGIEPLPLMFGIDTWKIALDNFKVSSRRMKSLSIFAGIPMDKEEPEGDRWMKAAFNGDKDAMDKILSHNIRDVEILEKLAQISFPYLRSIPKL